MVSANIWARPFPLEERFKRSESKRGGEGRVEVGKMKLRVKKTDPFETARQASEWHYREASLYFSRNFAEVVSEDH
jgi:hypothetical protein